MITCLLLLEHATLSYGVWPPFPTITTTAILVLIYFAENGYGNSDMFGSIHGVTSKLRHIHKYATCVILYIT